MDTKVFLKQAWFIDQQICTMLAEIVKTQSLMEAINRSSEAADKLQEKQENSLRELIKIKLNITKMIKMVYDPSERAVLELRYLKREKWNDIATQIGYSQAHTFKLHNSAIKSVSELIANNNKKCLVKTTK